MQRQSCLCLLSLAGVPLALAVCAPTGCTFTLYEKELVVAPRETADEASPATLAVVPEASWVQFLDINHIVDSFVELFKHTTAKEAIGSGVHYTERKRFLHVEIGPGRPAARRATGMDEGLKPFVGDESQDESSRDPPFDAR